jgi:hypothetical protein
VSLFNRLLPVGIVFYRYVYVCRVSWVQTAAQRKSLNILISGFIFIVSFALTFTSFIYREKNFYYLACIGKEEYFHSQNKSSLRLVWLLPLYHPFHLLSILAFFSYAFMVPIGYFCIYRFRRHQDSSVKGLSERARVNRVRKNLVTTKTNLIIWICEVVSGFVVALPGSQVFIIAYFFIPNSVSPMLYYAGIEMNRQEMKYHLAEVYRESKERIRKTFRQ